MSRVHPALLPHLRRAKDLADRCYAEPLDLAAFAAAAGCSRHHFLRCFQAAYGETPGRYLTRRRIERARDLLRHTNLSVTEICHLVGFSSLGSFSARFSGLVGISPSRYREEATRSGPAPIPGCFVLMWTRPHDNSSIAEKRTAPARSYGRPVDHEEREGT
ncbi:helix-turn-helix transcriptional regulator [Streptoalloteichus hindustanus]|uniref:AraC-type DNA-binding protein n=1 Tax=Streptoalloteichus hindustanus TaxID=2017 RepID=A0A1M5B4E9_STRHI|nr:helix-turn-helix transcriptional regulator [Streptoalloteichus hindustanus]SHF37373.1 AraC-type DNA-binding protein [Streptoalloteichus hindustanus]